MCDCLPKQIFLFNFKHEVLRKSGLHGSVSSCGFTHCRQDGASFSASSGNVLLSEAQGSSRFKRVHERFESTVKVRRSGDVSVLAYGKGRWRGTADIRMRFWFFKFFRSAGLQPRWLSTSWKPRSKDCTTRPWAR